MRIAYVCDEFSVRHLKILLAIRALRPQWSIVVMARNYRNPEFQPHYLHHTWHSLAHIEMGLRAYPCDVAFVAPSLEFGILAAVKSACPKVPVVFQVFDWLVDRKTIIDGFRSAGLGVVGSFADAATVRKETGVNPLVIYPAMPTTMIVTLASQKQGPFTLQSMAYYGGINEHETYRDYMPVFERLRAQGWNHPIFIYSANTPSRELRARYEAAGIPVFDPRRMLGALTLVSHHTHVWVGANSPECSFDCVVRNVLFDVLATGAIPVSCGLAEQDAWMICNGVGEVVTWDRIAPTRMDRGSCSLPLPAKFTAEHWVEPLVKSLEA
jgi:hypothetical protein